MSTKTSMEVTRGMLGAGVLTRLSFCHVISPSPFLPYLHTSAKLHLNEKPQTKKLLKSN